jgi:predicted Rossmann-fold nucleotide-binding protein
LTPDPHFRNSEVKNAWQTFFRVVVHMMKKGYANLTVMKPLVIASDQKSLITEVRFFLVSNPLCPSSSLALHFL